MRDEPSRHSRSRMCVCVCPIISLPSHESSKLDNKRRVRYSQNLSPIPSVRSFSSQDKGRYFNTVIDQDHTYNNGGFNACFYQVSCRAFSQVAPQHYIALQPPYSNSNQIRGKTSHPSLLARSERVLIIDACGVVNIEERKLHCLIYPPHTAYIGLLILHSTVSFSNHSRKLLFPRKERKGEEYFVP